jgi:hypothetical protein
MSTDAQRLRQEWEDKQAFSRAARQKASQEFREGLRLQDAEVNRTARANASAGMRGDVPDHTTVAEITPQGINVPPTRSDMSKPPSSQEMSGNQRANMLMEASKGLQNATKGNSGQTDSTSSAANMALSTGMSGASIAAMSGASGATIAGAGAAAAGAGVAIGMIQAAAARRQARNALENQKQLKLIDIEDARTNRIQSALQSMASNMGQTLRNNQQIRL